MPVEYRDVPGFPGYRVGSDGSVFSCWTRAGMSCRWKKLTVSRTPQGYLMVRFSRPRPAHVFVHRLLLLVFVGLCPPGMEACHNDGNKANNILSNLRWDTRVGNIADR